MAILDTGTMRHHLVRLTPECDLPRGTVALVHGLLTDSLASYYFTLAPGLVAAGWDVVLYDLRGHGRSSRPAQGYELDDFVDDLEAVLLHERAPRGEAEGQPEQRPPSGRVADNTAPGDRRPA